MHPFAASLGTPWMVHSISLRDCSFRSRSQRCKRERTNHRRQRVQSRQTGSIWVPSLTHEESKQKRNETNIVRAHTFPSPGVGRMAQSLEAGRAELPNLFFSPRCNKRHACFFLHLPSVSPIRLFFFAALDFFLFFLPPSRLRKTAAPSGQRADSCCHCASSRRGMRWTSFVVGPPTSQSSFAAPTPLVRGTLASLR